MDLLIKYSSSAVSGEIVYQCGMGIILHTFIPGGLFLISVYKMFLQATYLGEYLSRFLPFKGKNLAV